MMSSSISIAMISPSSNWSFLGGAGGAYSRAGPVPFFLLRGRAFPYEWLNLLPLLVFLSPLPQYTDQTSQSLQLITIGSKFKHLENCDTHMFFWYSNMYCVIQFKDQCFETIKTSVYLFLKCVLIQTIPTQNNFSSPANSCKTQTKIHVFQMEIEANFIFHLSYKNTKSIPN